MGSTGGQAVAEGVIPRVTASEIEALVLERLRALQAKSDAPLSFFLPLISRIEVLAHGVRLALQSDQLIVGGDREGQLWQFRARLDPLDELSFSARAKELHLLIGVRPIFRGGRTWMVRPNGGSVASASDRHLIKALVQSYEGLAEYNSAPTQTPGAWRQATAIPRSYLRQVYPAAFLAPDLQRLILEGRQPAGLTAAQLIEGGVPLAWTDQRRLFGIDA